MPAPRNPLKAALQARQMQIGFWIGLDNPVTGAIAADAGFDWCLLDMEHAPLDFGALANLLTAMERRAAALALRVPSDDAVVLKRVLDLGVQTILVPMVNTPDQAEAIVRACRYPPAGIRGYGASVSRSGGYGAFENYTENADQELCILVQAESRQALDNIEAIAAVDGIDGIFIGPADLAADMGYLGQTAHPEVQSAIEEGLKRIAQTGKAAGYLTFDPDSFAPSAELGVRFLAVGSDVALFADTVRALAALARGKLG